MTSTPRRRTLAVVAFWLLVSAVVIGLFLYLIGFGTDPSGAIQRLVDSFYPPAAVTEQGSAILDLYTIVFLIAVVVFFLVEGLIIWTVLRYRRKPGDDTLPPQTHGNLLAEAIWTIVPTIIVAFLFVVSWQTLNTVDAVSDRPDLKVRAIAGQFQWTFEYLPDDWEPTDRPLKEPLYTEFVPTGERPEDGGMAVPVGQNVRLYLTSPDVIHAFYVPQFLYKRDVVPGRTNVFEFRVNSEDVGQRFGGQCAELCGAGHRVMLFDVHALSPGDFDAWLAAKIERASATPPPAPSAEPGQSPDPGGGSGDTVIQIAANNIAFDTSELRVPAGQGFRIEFDNQEAQPHNVAIHEGSPTGPEVFRGEIFTGPAQRTYEVPALEAGTYGFVCTVHPNMTGTLTAE